MGVGDAGEHELGRREAVACVGVEQGLGKHVRSTAEQVA